MVFIYSIFATKKEAKGIGGGVGSSGKGKLFKTENLPQLLKLKRKILRRWQGLF
jgi:hypothetical protein